MTIPEQAYSGKKALIAGATGLTGKALLEILQGSDYEKIIALTRHKETLPEGKLVWHHVDFDNLSDYPAISAVDDVYCCLGTTIKKAGSREAFERVDLHYVEEVAQLAARAGAGSMFIMSSLGASSGSSGYYLRIKGKMEEAVSDAFPGRIAFFRPSLLLGERKESRPGETFAKAMGRLLSPLFQLKPLRKYAPVEARTVAQAMYAVAGENWSGRRVVDNESIMAYGKQGRS